MDPEELKSLEDFLSTALVCLRPDEGKEGRSSSCESDSSDEESSTLLKRLISKDSDSQSFNKSSKREEAEVEE